MIYSYDDAGIAAVSYNGTRYYYVKNLQGDVIGLVNGSGNYVVKYSYDAWGNIVSTTGSMASTLGQYNPFRYRSYYYDVETGFYYLQSRYYDPTVGRFLNADAYVSTGQGFTGNNMFAYCGNNPVIRADANGDFWEFIVAGIIAVGGLLLTGCTSDPNETLVGTHADPASDVYFSDKDKAIQYACDVAYTKMLDKFDETGSYHEYSIFVVRHNEAVYDSSLYYVTTEKSSGATEHNYADYSILTDPDLSIVAWIHTHPTDKPYNHDYIFNEKDMDKIDLYNVDMYVVEKSGTIWKLTKDKSNFTQEDKWGTARNRHSNGGTLCMIKSILYSY